MCVCSSIKVSVIRGYMLAVSNTHLFVYNVRIYVCIHCVHCTYICVYSLCSICFLQLYNFCLFTYGSIHMPINSRHTFFVASLFLIYIIHHTSHIIHHTSYIIHHTSYIIHHTSYITHHTSHIIHHTSHITHHTSHIIHLQKHILTDHNT